MSTILSILAIAGASLQAPPPLDQGAWTRAANPVFVTADPTLFIPDGKGSVRAATPEEAAALNEELSRLTKAYYRARGLVDAGRRGEAIERLEELRAEADTVETSALLAELYLVDGRPLLARGLVAQKMRRSDDRRLLLVAAALNAGAGTVAPGQLDYCRAAVGEYMGSIEADVRRALDRTTDPSALAYLALGREWDMTDRSRAARTLYERAWKADRGNPVVAWLLAKTLRADRRFEEATKIAGLGRARATGKLREALDRP